MRFLPLPARRYDNRYGAPKPVFLLFKHIRLKHETRIWLLRASEAPPRGMAPSCHPILQLVART
jgi:hypothetical protein